MMEMEEEEGGVEVEEREEDDEDIYGDLEEDIFWGPPTKKQKPDNVVDSEQYQALVKENHNLKLLVKKLKRDNKNYSDNISSLFLTAKNEMDKKNFIIKNLSDRLKKVSGSKSVLTRQESEEVLTKCQEALVESQHTVTLDEISNKLKAVPQYHTKRKRKHIKFGNMSLYFFTEQCNIEREEPVEFFPKKKGAETEKSNDDNGDTIENLTRDPTNDSETRNRDRENPERRDSSSASASSSATNCNIISSSNERSNKLSCDNDKSLPERKSDLPPARRRSYDKDLVDRDRRTSDRNSYHKRPHSPSVPVPDRQSTSNRKDDYDPRSRVKEHDPRSSDYHSRDRKGHRIDDHRSSKRITRRSTNELKHNDGKRHSHRSRSRSR